jgi:hypothetical protein
MRHVEVVPRRRLVRPIVVVAALAAALAGCSPMGDQAVSASAGAVPPPAAAAAPEPAPASKFQGSVSSVDADGSAFVVSVRIVWTPVLEGRAHDRRVLVDGGTRWEPGSLRLNDVRVGEEIQVEADPAGDAWRASKIQLFDVD